ncbi:MAG TPA: hypothetical protein VN541_22330 [Tepidisphaeraceae bacterium]|nr:hypothetical protein [Tepidisphaeraceae bacterium]
MNLIRTAVWVCAASLLVGGQGSARSGAARPIRAEAQAANRASRLDNRQPSDQEWAAVQQWMKQHSPNRWQFLQKQMSGNPAQFLQAKQLIWNEYRIVQQVNYPALKQAMTAQAEAQDQVFGAQIALREARQSHNADREETARNALKAAVEHLVDGEQTVIQTRIEKLQRDLERLKERHDQRVTQIYRAKFRQAGGTQARDADIPPAEGSEPQE